MKSKAVVCAIMALCLSASGFTFAQGDDRNNDRGNNGRNQGAQRADQRDQRGAQKDNRGRPPQGRGNGNGNGNGNARHEGERGGGPNQSFYRGERLPAQYRGNQYVVDDWRGHRLSAPPRGYHWVQSGGDYLLVAITTGIIMQLLLNN